MSTPELHAVLAKFGIAGTSSERLEDNIILRGQLIKAVIGGKLSPELTTAARGLVSDIDKSIFTDRRLTQDKDVETNKAELLKDIYRDMVTKGGRDFDMAALSNAPVAAPEARELGAVHSEFVIDTGELIGGNDTEESVLSE